MVVVCVRRVGECPTALGFDPPLLTGNLNLPLEGLELIPPVELDLEQDWAGLGLDMVKGLTEGFEEGNEQRQEQGRRPSEPMEVFQAGFNPNFPGVLRGHCLVALLNHES